MKNIFLLLVVITISFGNVFAQYQKAYDQGKRYEQTANYYKAIQYYNAAFISRDKPKDTDIDTRINFCANKLDYLRIEVENALTESIKQTKIADEKTKIADEKTEIANTALEKVNKLSDENFFLLYNFNATLFANKSMLFHKFDTLKFQLSTKSYELNKYSYETYRKGKTVKFIAEVFQALNSSFHSFNDYKITDIQAHTRREI